MYFNKNYDNYCYEIEYVISKCFMLLIIKFIIFKEGSIQMIKNQQVMPDQPIYKKIQNYIFKFSDLLGQGNFSKVYKAHHELTSTKYII